VFGCVHSCLCFVLLLHHTQVILKLRLKSLASAWQDIAGYTVLVQVTRVPRPPLVSQCVPSHVQPMVSCCWDSSGELDERIAPLRALKVRTQRFTTLTPLSLTHTISQDIPFAAAEGDSSSTQHSSRTPVRQLLYELLELALGRDPISGLTRLRRREASHVAVAAGGVQRHTVLDFFDGDSASSLSILLPSTYLNVSCSAPQSCLFWMAC
jgi:hypothetical protein